MSRPKLIMIIGPTSSGKTSLGVKLARRFKGEIISADSRQVYRGMDIGTGKDLEEYGQGKQAVKYHLIDIVSPKTVFNLSKYLKAARIAIADILNRGKLPIIVGGTGLYAQALADNFELALGKPDLAKRQQQEQQTAEQLMAEIVRLQPNFAAKINNSDRHNKRRLARYLEIIEQNGAIVAKRKLSPYDFLIIGLDWPDDVLKDRIEKRLDKRLRQGMIEEVKKLHQSGISWKRLLSFGLEYRFVSRYLTGEINQEQLTEKLGIAIYRFAKRQKTWFKRWVKQGREIIEVSDEEEAVAIVKRWLKN